MKIYASRSTANLSKYAGKDVWVKVHISKFYRDYYIRIAYIEDGIVYYNLCSADSAEDRHEIEFDPFDALESSVPMQEYIDQTLSHLCQTPEDKIIIVPPVDILTTDDIVDGLTAHWRKNNP